MKPNVLLLTCHDLGRHLGCYGVEGLLSRNIDQLAKTGVRFTRTFSTAPSCSPSRAAIATGRYPHSNGVMGLAHPPYDWDLHPAERHFAQILGEAGYETHLFGLQHVSPHMERLGFEHVHRFQRKALSREVAPQVVELLVERTASAAATRGERPFYLEVNLEQVHRPFAQGGVKPDSHVDFDIPSHLPHDSSSVAEMAKLRAAIKNVDADVGRILKALFDCGLWEETLIVFTTDHGLALPRAKCTLYDPGIETALIVSWPRELRRGQVVDELVSNIDILPTVLELVGISIPKHVQGLSLASLLKGSRFESRGHVFAEKTFHTYYDPMRAVRTETYKYIRNFETAFAVEVPGDVEEGEIFRNHVELYHGTAHPLVELYDLTTDPLEQKNLAGDAEFGEVRGSLEETLWGWMEGTEDPLLHGAISSPVYRRALDTSL